MIKRLFDSNADSKYIHIVLLLLRLSAIALIINHGFPKLNTLLSGGEIKFGDPIGLGPENSFFLVVFAEFFCSVLVLLGLGTRLATIPLIINFIVIVFVVHLPHPFSRKELPLFYLISYISLFIMGSGKYSLDHLLINKTINKSSFN